MNLRSKFEQLMLGLLDFPVPRPAAPSPPAVKSGLENGAGEVIFRRNNQARRYVLRVNRNGQVIVTLPRRGTMAFAREFLAGRRAWLDDQVAKHQVQREIARQRAESSTLLFRGVDTAFTVEPIGGHSWARLEGVGERIRLRPGETARAAVGRWLRDLAARELPPLALEFARQHQCRVAHVSVRGQRSRWGSCSVRGRISLNWRLVQAPLFVRDYIILHELMHLREMNHSRRFWRHVASVCPAYETAEKWLRAHNAMLDPDSAF